MNPFKPLYEKCNTGTNAEKFRNLPDFPTIIDVEPAGVCNFKCKMCPTGVGTLGRAQDFMSMTTFSVIVGDCVGRGTGIRFIGFGEPLLHPEIVNFVQMANDAGLPTHINTNGSKLTEKMAGDLLSAGLDSIKFSFQGVDSKSFSEMRKIDYFEPLLDKIAIMSGVRSVNSRPYISVSTTTTNETQEQIEAFKDRLYPMVDQITVGKTIFDFMGDGAKDEGFRHPKPCPEVNDKLSIHWDGSVVTCCNDFSGKNTIGNVQTVPIELLWTESIIEKYREHLSKDDYSLPLCNVCWDYMGLTEGAES